MNVYALVAPEALAAQAASGNPYHNGAHAHGVVNLMCTLMRRALVRASAAEFEDGALAALFHDYGHSGTTIRADATRVVPHPTMGNEEYAVMMMRARLLRHVPPERLTRIEGLIMSTTFGRTPHPHPATTPLEKFLELADLGGFIDGPSRWMEESFAVLAEQIPSQRPTTFVEFRESRLRFLRAHLQQKLDGVVPLLEPSFAMRLQSDLDEVMAYVSGTAFDACRARFAAAIAPA